MKDDSISRRVASEAVCKMLSNCFNATDETIESVKITVGELPPAQPSVSKTEMVEDTIIRQAAVSGISDLLMLELKGERLPTYNEVYRAIYDLPSAQSWETTDIKDILAYLDGVVHPLVSPENWDVYSELHDMISGLLKHVEGGQDDG